MTIEIEGIPVASFEKPFIIAEIGANHNGDMKLAETMIAAAAACGAHCVKFQSWTENSLISKSEYIANQKYDDSPKKHFGSLKEMVQKYQLDIAQHKLLKDLCKKYKVIFNSTPFSVEEADLLNELDVPFFKIASMDINHPRLLRHVAKFQKPIFLSTGMASLREIDHAVQIIEDAGNKKIVLLHCISIYPPDPKDIHLNNLGMLRAAYPNYPIGFSDHSIGSSIPLAAIALGSAVIEKHFTTDKTLEGWDHEISADPVELKMIVEDGTKIVLALGSSRRIVSAAESEKKKKFRRSIVVTREMRAGEVIASSDLAFKRPGTHIEPVCENMIIGRKVARDLDEDSLLSWEDLV